MAKRIIIIGGGPGGYVAAIRAAQLGAQVLVVEKEHLGGTCLNWGCVPTKSLLHASRIFRTMQDTRKFGIYCTSDSLRFDEMVAKKNEVVRNNVRGIENLFAKNKIELINGIARLSGFNSVKIEDSHGNIINESADALIIATGSEPLTPGFMKFDGDRVITTTEALDLDTLPQSIAIVGGSVSGCEFACLFGQLGSNVYLIEMLERLVPTEDPEISRRLAGALKRLGVKVMTKTAVQSIERQYPDGSVNLSIDKGQINAEYCMLAMGRKLNTENIGLAKVDIDFSAKGIKVNDRMQTNVSGVYAVGDVTGKYLLAHVASEQGIVAVENVMGNDVAMDYAAVPNFIYTDPEIASVGLKPEEALEKGMEIAEGKATFKTNAMAHALDETTGFVKTVLDKQTKKVVGIHIFGPHATDLLGEAVTIVKSGMTFEDVKWVIHPHPTLCETLKEAVLATEEQAIHV
jgi:dihydrolipoamide dehydrogenase